MERSYYAIIPANVRYDKNLKDKAKLLYGEITALCNEQGYCWATNSYFAELYGIAKETVSRLIKNLADQKYIYIQLEYKDKQIIRRKIYLGSVIPIDQKINTYCVKSQEPIDDKIKDNNTLNNTINNKKETDLDKTINSYTDNKDLKETIKDFLKMRKSIKKPMTGKALTLLLNKLDKMSDNNDLKIEILNQSILHSWQTVYQLKDAAAPETNNNKYQEFQFD